MKILLTGATGLVGKALGIALAKKGHEIIVVSRRPLEAKKQCPFPCEVIESDLSKGPIESSSLSAVDGVINLMGEPIAKGFWTETKKQKLRDSRVLATQNLVNSFNKRKPSVFISASAIGIYGDRGDELLPETASPQSDFLAQLCQDWEAEALKMASASTRVCIPRIGLVLSSQGGILSELTPLFRAGLGGKLSNGQQWMSWIHIDDLVQSILCALDTPDYNGPYNAVAPNPVSNKDFTNLLATHLHRPAFAPAPKFALKVFLQEKSAILLASQRVQCLNLDRWGFRFKYSHLEEALNAELQNEKEGEDIFLSQQYIPLPPEQIFPFFAEAQNLEKITPKTLNFKILSVSTPSVQSGTLIDYTLRIRGVPVHWKTEIENWNPPHVFVDNQLKGPYKLWHHTHAFEKLGNGTLMTDRVRFKVPLGFLGWAVGNAFVRSEVEGIFSYRREVIYTQFVAPHQ
ncbi:MAG: hypothetical protein RJB66_1966 [Pseudomonadota bacterium]|jgi:uncharacterized protein (TIGR01777 family)